MISPFSAAVLPTPLGGAIPRGKDPTVVEDFGAWLDAEPPSVAPPPAPGQEDASRQDFLGAMLVQELAQTPSNLTPSVGPVLDIASRTIPDVGPIPTLPATEAEPTLAPTALPAGPVQAARVPIDLNTETAAARPARADPVPPSGEAVIAPTDAIATTATVSTPYAGVEQYRASIGAGGERVDFVALRWHLQANAGLSYRSVESGALTAGSTQPQLHTPLGLPSVSGTAIGQAQLPVLANRKGQPEALPSPVELSHLREARREERAAGPADVDLPRNCWAPLPMWPQRILRWLGDAEGTTAWVRDYQIELSKVQTLLDSLRCLAEQQGLPLRRVMLNGHELWRSPSTP